MTRLPKTFAGYLRAFGPPGVRNHLLVLSVCGLNASGARKVQRALPVSVLVSTMFGRNQVGDDKSFHDAMLEGFGVHPNVGAVLLLAPDEKLRIRFQEAIEAKGRTCAGFSLQGVGEDGEVMVASAVEAGEALQRRLAEQDRAPCPIGCLTVAMECGHSDASSGIVANPLVGDFADQLIDAGGRTIISETLEWTGTETSLFARCQSPEVAEKLQHLVDRRHGILSDAGIDVAADNPGPQNQEGGITTLEEKSHGAVAKGGTSAIAGALAQGEAVPADAGLYLMDTPTLSPESISSMVAGGAQVVIFTTGHGNPYGSAVAPTLKLTANPETAERLSSQIDFDASEVFSGTLSRSEVLPALAALVVEVCEGREVAAEVLDECDEAISRLLPSV